MTPERPASRGMQRLRPSFPERRSDLPQRPAAYGGRYAATRKQAVPEP